MRILQMLLVAALLAATAAVLSRDPAHAAAVHPDGGGAGVAPGGPVHATLDSEGVQRVEIVGGDYFFRPDHVVVKVGVPVELSVRVEPGIAPHSIVLLAPEAGVSIDADLDTKAKVFRFIPRLAGRYPFYCRNRLLFFRSHRERGMEGVLEVVE